MPRMWAALDSSSGTNLLQVLAVVIVGGAFAIMVIAAVGNFRARRARKRDEER